MSGGLQGTDKFICQAPNIKRSTRYWFIWVVLISESLQGTGSFEWYLYQKVYKVLVHLSGTYIRKSTRYWFIWVVLISESLQGTGSFEWYLYQKVYKVLVHLSGTYIRKSTRYWFIWVVLISESLQGTGSFEWYLYQKVYKVLVHLSGTYIRKSASFNLYIMSGIEWMFKWSILQLYHGENQLHSMKWSPLCTRQTCLIGSLKF